MKIFIPLVLFIALSCIFLVIKYSIEYQIKLENKRLDNIYQLQLEEQKKMGV